MFTVLQGLEVLEIPNLYNDGSGWNVALYGESWHKLSRDLLEAFSRPIVLATDREAFIAEALAENGIVSDTVAADLHAERQQTLPAALKPAAVAASIAPVPADVLDGFAAAAAVA
ncbi:hypothetical protein [Aureimonas psammosilenae]|uniref:hypothetical protein n=1 Tax=Aureimonas psammosilenae TaxID=2495496 RepID=UPI001260FDBA|nr:hypothetical protein [Aureimonas psammosilenae]